MLGRLRKNLWCISVQKTHSVVRSVPVRSTFQALSGGATIRRVKLPAGNGVMRDEKEIRGEFRV